MKKRGCAINYTKAVALVCNHSKQWVSYEKIRNLMKEEFVGVPEDKIEDLIINLLEHGYIYTNLRSPLTYHNPLGYTLDLLETYSLDDATYEMVNLLKKIENQRCIYNGITIGNGYEELNRLLLLMANMHECKDYLNAISTVQLREEKISMNVKKEGEKISQFVKCFFNI